MRRPASSPYLRRDRSPATPKRSHSKTSAGSDTKVGHLRSLLRDFALIPLAGERVAWRTQIPRTRGHQSTTLLLSLVLLAYGVTWIHGHAAYLFDPLLQADDARIALFPFLAYSGHQALASDPVAREMSAFISPGIWLLYRLLVPSFGLFIAMKIVQGIAFSFFLAAAFILGRSPRGGLGAAAILLFLTLRSPEIVSTIAGGLPRAFAFPMIALWLAGVIAQSERTRFTAVILAGLLIPTAMALLLSAEALVALYNVTTRQPLPGHLRRFALLAGCCLARVGVYTLAHRHQGSVVSLDAAKASGAFGRHGRLNQSSGLPLPDPAPVFGHHLVSPFLPAGLALASSLAASYRDLASTGPLVILAALAFLVLVRASPPERGLAFLGLASLGVYFLARVFAFKLYSPQRYGSYGLPMVTIAFTAITLGRLGSHLPTPRRLPLQSGVAAAFILALWTFAGSGVRQPPYDGITLSGRAYPSHLRVDPRIKVTGLYPALRHLDPKARIAAHPIDANDISLWSGRPSTPSYETLQPWFTLSWRRLRTEAERTLTAIYATRKDTVIAFCTRDHVTHLLLNRGRYSSAFRQKAKSFEPLDHFVAQLLRDVATPNAFVLTRVPPSAVV